MQLPAEILPEIVKPVLNKAMRETALSFKQIKKIKSHANVFANFDKSAEKKIESNAAAFVS